MHYADPYSKLPLIVIKEFIKHSVSGNKPIYISAGGTTPLSTLGYVNAAFELQEQVERGEIPKPDFIFVAVGTGGTMAGLMLGSILSGLNAKIIGVRVVPKLIASRFTVSRLVNKTRNLIRNYVSNIPKFNMSSSEVIIIPDYLGKGYGHRTEKSKEAVNIAAEKGILLEDTYTGKTFAAFLDFVGTRNSGVFLFWNTFNSVDLDEVTRKVDYRTLPQEFHRLFTCRVD
jgi:1-aminocyclopropane-1-carboxylate deaminase